MTNTQPTTLPGSDEAAIRQREIVIALTNAYYEEYRYDRPNDSVAELTAFCRDLAENEVDQLITTARINEISKVSAGVNDPKFLYQYVNDRIAELQKGKQLEQGVSDE